MLVPCGGGGCGGGGCGGSCSSGGGVVVFVVVVVLVVVVALVLAVVVGVVVLVYFSMSQNHNHNNDSRKERLATFDLLCSQGFQLSLACCLAVLLVYDVLVVIFLGFPVVVGMLSGCASRVWSLGCYVVRVSICRWLAVWLCFSCMMSWLPRCGFSSHTTRHQPPMLSVRTYKMSPVTSCCKPRNARNGESRIISLVKCPAFRAILSNIPLPNWSSKSNT